MGSAGERLAIEAIAVSLRRICCEDDLCLRLRLTTAAQSFRAGQSGHTEKH
jgi:hypothetical protein